VLVACHRSGKAAAQATALASYAKPPVYRITRITRITS